MPNTPFKVCSYLSLIWTLLISNSGTAAADSGPSLVSVNEHQLIVSKRNADGSLGPPAPFTIRGVVWSPASRNTNTSPADPANPTKRRPEFGNWFAVDVPLMQSMNVNTARLLIDPGFDATAGPVGLAVLDECFARGIMVIMTVDDGINDMNRVSQAVSYYKDHPAVLMWMLGSEWNINLYFNHATSIMDAATKTEAAAALIKSLDPNHPVATSYGEIDINAAGLRLSDTEVYVNEVIPSVDVWALNIYRGDDFNTLFDQWQSITSKPLFLGEFGTDAFRVKCARSSVGTVAEQLQADWDVSLWNDIFPELSAADSSKVALGGTLFEFSDEWWKVSPPGSQQSGGFIAVGPHPDDFFNEEYFGLLDIDRNPRQVYSKMQLAFRSDYEPGQIEISVVELVDLRAAPASIETNIPTYFIAGTTLPGNTVMLNGAPVEVDSSGTFVSRFPIATGSFLEIGANPVAVTIYQGELAAESIQKTVIYNPSLLTDERRLVYVDSVAPDLDGTVVIDLDTNSYLGFFPGEHVRALSKNGTEIYMESKKAYSTAIHSQVPVPSSPLAFASVVPSNGFVESPTGPYLYSRAEVLDRQNNILTGTLPKNISTGSAYLGGPVPGGPAIAPDGTRIWCCTTSSALTQIDLIANTQSSVALSFERTFQSDLTISPNGQILARTSYGGASSFRVGFYDTSDFALLSSSSVGGDFAGEVVFSALGDKAIVGCSGNPANRGGNLTVIDASSFLQEGCALIDLADNLAVTSRSEVFASSGNHQGLTMVELDDSGGLLKKRGYFLGINRFVPTTGLPKNDEIRRIVIKELPVLSVSRSGSGSGSISSSPGGIDCGKDCEDAFKADTEVTLSAQPSLGSSFVGWAGDLDCADGFVEMDSDKSCEAVFDLQNFQLTVDLQGTGTGTVTSTPAGVSCGATCSAVFDYNTSVSLSAQPSTGSVFSGWSGDADCSDGAVTMVAARSCTATFTLQQFALSVSKAGNGVGTVTSTPAGVSCGATCSATFDYNTSVSLSAQPITGSVFSDWSGDADCTDGIVTMDAARSCTAAFTLQQHTLSILVSGNGTGTVTSDPVGIFCGVDCSHTFDYGSVVSLTAIADAGSVFSGWRGACELGTVLINSETTCEADFQSGPIFLDGFESGDTTAWSFQARDDH